MAYLSQDEIHDLGFGKVGCNVLISNKASFYNCGKIEIGDNVRIDDFCVISAGEGGVYIGSYIHIAVFCSIIGAGKVSISNYANLSSRVSIYSSNDDYSGHYMTNPLVPIEFINVSSGSVFIGKHVIIGSGSVVLPNVVINEGAVVGALTLIKDTCKEFTVYTGVPAKAKKRTKP
ncbi:putative lipopolysaccharide biosynthesis O-acetyl transferase WbbJ [Kluyvera cryocrescens]|uniref:Chloramphenicol acetyltransferase n=1 Tax=Kluyvera cryocrescens TaxID=580 RepID=A0A485BT78_KLUCR|nr:putative lipopolysaccharide biosynthesis O-acetyl transferase WbbJ [Kluyvera cryocrescens]